MTDALRVRLALHAVFMIALTGAACSPDPANTARPANGASSAALAVLDAQIARYAPVDLKVDISGLPGNEAAVLTHIIRAAQVMDGIFLEQVWAGNPALLARLAADDSPEGRARLHYFLINKGPWSRLDKNESFLPAEYGVPKKPEQANYYPADATKAEIETWFGTLPGPGKSGGYSAKTQAAGFFTIIRRFPLGMANGMGGFHWERYDTAYQNELTEAAAHLRKAAELTSQPTLKKFLELRAKAFLSNDYFESDIAWMELDASIEPTIGPYETYEDEWFGYKAAFEAFVTIRDDAETKRLGMFSSELQALENALPIDPALRNPKLGAFAPIRVVNAVFTAGDGNRGVQTAAFNLPNDDRVIKEKGSKRVMLKNMQDAKFAKVLLPISGVALNATDRANVSFEAFFTHILMHELMHGLGPQQVRGTDNSVRQALQETGGAIEEAKADISGLWALQQLADRSVVSPRIAQTMYTTFLASAFRSIRFGITEAHGKGIALQLNYLLDRGAFVVNADGTFSVAQDKIKQAAADLTRDLMTIQANGDYTAAQALLNKMVVIRPEVQRVLDKLTGVPVDIEPRFVTAKELLRR
jgi:tetratricopeptide (TPR) repeat protein